MVAERQEDVGILDFILNFARKRRQDIELASSFCSFGAQTGEALSCFRVGFNVLVTFCLQMTKFNKCMTKFAKRRNKGHRSVKTTKKKDES